MSLWLGLLTGAALASFVALSWLSKPGDYRARLDRVQGQIAYAQARLAGQSSDETYRAGAICAVEGDADSVLSARILTAAAASGVTVSGLSTTRAGPPSEASRLTQILVQFEARGRNDAVVAMLATLSRQSPTIFVDRADLTPQISVVDYKMMGRVFCRERP